MTKDEFDQVVKNYPYPIAGLFIRLRTRECLKPNFDRRLKCILDVAEAISRFLSALVLCQCRDHAEQHPGDTPPAALSTDFRKHLRQPSWGRWLQFTREGLKWLIEQETPAVLARELAGFYFDRPPRESQAAEALDRLLTARNDLVHGRRPAHYAPQIEALCEESYAELTMVIQGLGFLAKYQLSFVDQIEVQKRRRHDPQYDHSFEWLQGGGTDFAGSEEPLTLTAPLESKAVVLTRGEGGAYLNLDPLLILDDASGAAKDLFFYNRMDDPTAMEYAGCKQGGQFQSARCKDRKRAAALAEEMEILLRLFAPAAEGGSGGR